MIDESMDGLVWLRRQLEEADPDLAPAVRRSAEEGSEICGWGHAWCDGFLDKPL